jgi:hypothetical protein
MYHLQSPSIEPFVGAITPPISPFQSMVAAIDLAASAPLARRHRAVAAALKPFLGLPDLLCHMSCPCSPDRYVRHLLHAGADYTVLALVWRPGQMSPVHGHRSWCALGIHHGCMTETLFDPGPTGPEPRGCFQREPSATVRVTRMRSIGWPILEPRPRCRFTSTAPATIGWENRSITSGPPDYEISTNASPVCR